MHSFIGVSCSEFWGLAYIRYDILDITMWCLQVYWEGSKIACFIIFGFCLQGRFFFFYLSLTIQQRLDWSQLEPTPILAWQLNKWAKAPILVQQCSSWVHINRYWCRDFGSIGLVSLLSLLQHGLGIIRWVLSCIGVAQHLVQQELGL